MKEIFPRTDEEYNYYKANLREYMEENGISAMHLHPSPMMKERYARKMQRIRYRLAARALLKQINNGQSRSEAAISRYRRLVLKGREHD